MRARRASGGREGELLRRAKALSERVDPLLPVLSKGCPTERFDRLRAELEEVRAFRDDEKALGKLAHRGDDLARAYAGLLKFALDPELPAVLVAPFANGEIPFAPLARASNEAQVAVQYSDDPARLIYGYLDLARKGFHFYAGDRALFCTGRDPTPPAEFLARQMAELPYRLERLDGATVCAHLARRSPVPYLEVGWPAAALVVRVCRRCAKSDRHLLSSLNHGIAIPDPEGAFPVSVSYNVDCRSRSDCLHRHLPDLPRGLRKRYAYGKRSDKELLDEYCAEIARLLERPGGPLFVAEGVCYGPDREAFTNALDPTEEERSALQKVLPAVGGLFEVDEAAASRALERLWPGHAETIVASIVPDERRAAELVREARANPGRVSELLQRAARASRERETLDHLPRYSGLTGEAAFADAVARAYRAQGARAAEKLLVDRLPREGKERGIAFGFLIALGREGSHLWQFTPTEQEFGRSLVDATRPVLDAPSEGYHEALDRLLRSAGVPDWGTRLAS